MVSDVDVKWRVLFEERKILKNRRQDFFMEPPPVNYTVAVAPKCTEECTAGDAALVRFRFVAVGRFWKLFDSRPSPDDFVHGSSLVGPCQARYSALAPPIKGAQ